MDDRALPLGSNMKENLWSIISEEQRKIMTYNKIKTRRNEASVVGCAKYFQPSFLNRKKIAFQSAEIVYEYLQTKFVLFPPVFIIFY